MLADDKTDEDLNDVTAVRLSEGNETEQNAGGVEQQVAGDADASNVTNLVTQLSADLKIDKADTYSTTHKEVEQQVRVADGRVRLREECEP